MNEIITAREILDGFSQSLGVEGAQKLFDEVTAATGVVGKQAFTAAEAMSICNLLKEKQGLVKILGLTLATQIITKNMHK